MKLYNPFKVKETPFLVASILLSLFMLAVIIILFAIKIPFSGTILVSVLTIISVSRVIYAIFKGE